MSGVCEDATPVLDNFLPASGHSLLRGISPNERWKILRQISMPVEKGPENRYDFASFQERDSPSFIKFNPFSKEENYPLAPLRDDVPIIDPCSGHLSAGAEADLMIDGRSNFIQNGCDPTRPNAVVDMSERPQTPPIRPSALTADLSSDKRWNSRAVSEAAVRARLGGWTSPTRVRPASPKLPNILSNKTVFFNVDDATQVSNSRPSVQLRDMAAKRYCYTSSTQRSYEEVDWDTKLPPRFKPPASTLEKMADPVSQRFTLKRYDSGPEPWQLEDCGTDFKYELQTKYKNPFHMAPLGLKIWRMWTTQRKSLFHSLCSAPFYHNTQRQHTAQIFQAIQAEFTSKLPILQTPAFLHHLLQH
ncbi:protein SPMIP7 isoform X3 [Lepisosteus oculatus]|uniref:protein SPMIP7 isoform X3 n=1 Tax=Lepisosteus oculatus TaxID=7918 RepID=UPI000740365A|nr:PREDICTED: uncharacterized protein C7orf72 homolog isoform X3 [Lepisosteus oculatus]